MSSSWQVLKFGGTSVASRIHWQAIAAEVERARAAGASVLVVASALRGVTDALSELADASPSDQGAAIAALCERHARLAADLDVDAAGLLGEWTDRLRETLADHRPDGCSASRRAGLLGLGEWISTHLGALYLADRIPCRWVDAREALLATPESREAARRGWLNARVEAGPDAGLAARWASLAPVLITQGFVARNGEGETVVLGRGGSDTSAALLASRLGADQVDIWTDVPGLFSADPRHVEDARLIRELDHEEALEMAAGGAAVIHPRCIRAAADAGLAVHIRDLAHPDRGGTRVVASTDAPGDGARAVVRQPHMAVLLLRNRDIRQQVGFLAWVFGEVALAGVSVDLVATSETTTTLAIDRRANALDDPALEALAARLSARCRVTLHGDCAAVNLVGRGARRSLAWLASCAALLDAHPVWMVSQSANDLGISILVPTGDAPALVERLHQALLAARADDDRYGPSWRALCRVAA